MKNKQTNFQEKTDGVKPYIAYEKDFEKTNDFYEESLENQICMNYDFFPGIYNGEKWIKGDSSETESYYVEFCYRNQNMVEIFFGANDHGKKFEKSFALLRSAAKKFYLNNVDLEREVIKFSSIS
ncbi:MAG: hypothetical protein ACPGTS_01125, partial [Minisyncoccia bacterium]